MIPGPIVRGGGFSLAAAILFGTASHLGIGTVRAQAVEEQERPQKVVLKPGECWPRKDARPKICNDGERPFPILVKDGKLVSVDLGSSGRATVDGDGMTFDVVMSNGAGLIVTGNGNTVNVAAGATTEDGLGGAVVIVGTKNTVNNQDNGKGGTTFISDSGAAGRDKMNRLNLGGEPGNVVGGNWIVNP